jgi:hypothetical protein
MLQVYVIKRRWLANSLIRIGNLTLPTNEDCQNILSARLALFHTIFRLAFAPIKNDRDSPHTEILVMTGHPR